MTDDIDPHNPLYFIKCDSCEEYTYLYDHKVSLGFYGKGLCNKCDLEVIKSGFWSKERVLKCIMDRENHKHV